MASTAQILANQANAAKSTGPKTAEGKDASRRNALKHGLAAEKLVLPAEEGEVIAARIVAWTPALQPKDAYDHWLVEEVVVNSVRIDRCHVQENALRTRQADRAALSWDADRESEAEELGGKLAKSPAIVAGKLRRTKQGCQWLISRWIGLGNILGGNGEWNESQKRLALDLLGTPAELREGPTPLDGDRAALVREQVARLATRKAEALDELDAQERADAEVGLGPDRDKAIALTRRYEAACLRRLQSAQAQLKAKKGRGAAVLAPRPPEPDSFARMIAEEAEIERLIARMDREAAPMPRVDAPAALPKPAPAPQGNRNARRAQKALARRS